MTTIIFGSSTEAEQQTIYGRRTQGATSVLLSYLKWLVEYLQVTQTVTGAWFQENCEQNAYKLLSGEHCE